MVSISMLSPVAAIVAPIAIRVARGPTAIAALPRAAFATRRGAAVTRTLATVALLALLLALALSVLLLLRGLLQLAPVLGELHTPGFLFDADLGGKKTGRRCVYGVLLTVLGTRLEITCSAVSGNQ